VTFPAYLTSNGALITTTVTGTYGSWSSTPGYAPPGLNAYSVQIRFQASDSTVLGSQPTSGASSSSSSSSAAGARSSNSSSSGPTASTGGLSAGAKAGIGIGVTVGALCVLILAGYYLLRQRQRRSPPLPTDEPVLDDQKMPFQPQSGKFANAQPNFDNSNTRDLRYSEAFTSLSNQDTAVTDDEIRELDVPARGAHELETSERPHELGISTPPPQELGISTPPPPELGISTPPPQELDARTLASQRTGYTQRLSELDDETLHRQLQQVRKERETLTRINELARLEAELENVISARRQ
jgi:hypothetical protein